MPTGIPAADIAQAGLGAVQSVVGLINAGKARKEAEKLAASRPDYKVDPIVDENLALAKSDLSNGMSSAASKAYNDLNNGQFSSSLSAILKNGGSSNDIGSLYGNNQEGRLRLSMMKDELRLSQINNYLKTSANKQQEDQTQWQVNEFAPWQDAAQANAAARSGAQQQIFGGLNALGAGIGNAGQALSEGDQFGLPNYSTGGVPKYATSIPTAPAIQGTNTLTPMPKFP